MKEKLVKELNYIKNSNIRYSAEVIVDALPDYFYTIAASTTGKYHPSFSLNEGGLVRHSKAATKICYDLLENETIGNHYASDEKDLMILAILVHDGVKTGVVEEKYTKIDHPLLMSKFIKDMKDKLKLSEEEIALLTSCIESHMGPWNKDYNGNEILPKPVSKYQKMVHMCDYLASRKYLDIKFDEYDNIIE